MWQPHPEAGEIHLADQGSATPDAQGQTALTSQTAPGMRMPSGVSYAESPARSSSRVLSTTAGSTLDVSIAGDHEPIATMDRPWFQEALAAETADAQLRLHVHGTRGILERVAPIIEMLRAATLADPGIAELWDQDVDPRSTVHTAAARALVTKPGVRDGVTEKYAADLLFGLLSPELYLLFVRDRGWSPDQWEHWSHETLSCRLCTG